MFERLVTLTRYWFRSDAAVAQSALDAAGIESVIDEQRGLKLRVQQTDALRAGAVLDADCESLDEISEADEEPDEEQACPACGSPELMRYPRALLFAIVAAVFLGVGMAVGLSDAAFFGVLAAGLLLLISDRHKCADCGATWN